MIDNNSHEIIRPIHYLGSKLRMLDIIQDTVSQLNKANNTVCDLFAGSGTVTGALLNQSNVISIDIQKYSEVLCTALSAKYQGTETVESLINEIQNDTFSKQITKSMKALLAYEENSLCKAMKSDINDLFEIIEFGSVYSLQKDKTQKCSSKLYYEINNTIQALRDNNLLDCKETVITRYYGGIYFSYKQAIIIDQITNIAFKKDNILKNKIIAAVLTTTSEIVNTVGKQFAQPLKVRDKNGSYKKSLLRKIIKDRTLNPLELFKESLSYYLKCEKKNSNIFIRDDFNNIWNFLRKENVSVVYADPPYTRYHYSRYYHILETISLRDIPEVSTTFSNKQSGLSRALYRKDRHQSPFCIKSKVENAFISLFQGVSSIGANLILSYSPFEPSKAVSPRLQTIEQLIALAKRYYNKVEIISPGKFVHSKLNKKENSLDASNEAELLIVCTEIRK